MREVTLEINGKGFGITCDEGEEQRILELAAYVDSRVKDIAASGAASAESHLLVLTSLVLADEVFDLRSRLQENSSDDEALAVEAIEHLALKIEHIASRIQPSEAA